MIFRRMNGRVPPALIQTEGSESEQILILLRRRRLKISNLTIKVIYIKVTIFEYKYYACNLI